MTISRWLKKENGRIKKLWSKFSDKSYRQAYAESYLFASIADQLMTLRRDRGLTQSQLAKVSGKRQSQISKLERIDNNEATLKTLLSLAGAFDVVLDVKFVPFLELAKNAGSIRATRAAPKAYSARQLEVHDASVFGSEVISVRDFVTGRVEVGSTVNSSQRILVRSALSSESIWRTSAVSKQMHESQEPNKISITG